MFRDDGHKPFVADTGHEDADMGDQGYQDDRTHRQVNARCDQATSLADAASHMSLGHHFVFFRSESKFGDEENANRNQHDHHDQCKADRILVDVRNHIENAYGHSFVETNEQGRS